jgi:hypothetical protein
LAFLAAATSIGAAPMRDAVAPTSNPAPALPVLVDSTSLSVAAKRVVAGLLAVFADASLILAAAAPISADARSLFPGSDGGSR